MESTLTQDGAAGDKSPLASSAQHGDLDGAATTEGRFRKEAHLKEQPLPNYPSVGVNAPLNHVGEAGTVTEETKDPPAERLSDSSTTTLGEVLAETSEQPCATATATATAADSGDKSMPLKAPAKRSSDESGPWAFGQTADGSAATDASMVSDAIIRDEGDTGCRLLH